MSDARYHVEFADEAGERLGLMLVERPQLGYSRRLINPYAAKGSSGATKDSDLTEWSVVSQRDWRGGRGQEEMETSEAFLDGWNVETRIKGQLTLGPLPQVPTPDSLPSYEPGSAVDYGVGFAGPVVRLVNDESPFTQHVAVRAGNYYLFKFWVGGVAEQGTGFDYHIRSVKIYVKRAAATAGYIRVALHEIVNGSLGSELVYKDLTESDVGTSYGWVEFEFAAPEGVSVTDYAVKVTSDTAEANPYHVHSSMVPFQRSYGTYEIHYVSVARAMSFVAPAGGLTCSLVQLYLRKKGTPGTFTVELCSDSAGSPGATLKTKTVDMDAAASEGYRWVSVEWSSGQALTGGTTYWIVVEPPATADARFSYVSWGGDAAAGYGSGACERKVGSGSWTAQTEDLYFRVNRDELNGEPISFARYDDKWYVAAGDTVYEWDTGSSTWTTSEEVSGQTLTSLAVWGGYLWAARGAGDDVRRYNGTAWADAAGPVTATLLQAGGGYLHRSGTGSDDHRVYYTANGTDWAELGAAGPGDYAVTGMAWFRDSLVVATAMRLYSMAVEGYAYPLLDWSSQENADNGVGMLAWSKTGSLYIPLQFGLYRWNGDTMMAVGPEQGMGLPAARAGRIAALCATGNWLYAAVDAGASGYSSILAYGGRGGWHEVQRCEQEGQGVKALGFETLSSPTRLWYGMDKETRYLMMPDYTDNPWQWSGCEFNPAGEIEFSWIGGDLLEIVKDLHAVVVRGEGISSTQPVEVYYEVDRSGRWELLGRVTEGPRQELEFDTSDLVMKVVGSGSTTTTMNLATGSTTDDVAVGDWVRINGEIRQVASVTDSDTFVLQSALGAAPASEDVVYGSRPAGREFRLKLVLATEDHTATPKIKAVFVRFQNNLLDRFVYTLEVKVADGGSDLAGNPYPHAAADLRVLLEGWSKRVTPCVLIDPDGVEHTVKVVSAGEGGYLPEEGALPRRYASVYSMNLVEVR